MTNNFGIVSAVGVLVILCCWTPTPASALKCHVCNSLYNESCEKIENNRYLTSCKDINQNPDKNYTLCRTEAFSVSSVEFKMQSSRIIRSCGYEKHPKFSCFFNSNHDLKETICECVEDGCNEGATLRSTLQSVFLAVLSSYILSLTKEI